MCKKFYERYDFSKGGKVFSGVIIILSIVGFIFSSMRLNVIEASTIPKNSRDTVIYEVIKDASVVVFSTFGVNLLLGVCIERKEKNSAFEEFFSNEFLKSDTFNDMVPTNKQEMIYKKYQMEHVFNQKQDLYTMSEFFRRKLCENLLDYFYEKCEYNTYCEEENGMLKKTYVKNIIVKPLDKNVDIKNFLFFSMYTKKINGKEHLKITGVYLKNQKKSQVIPLIENQHYYVEQSNRIDEALKRKNGYDSHCQCYLTDETVKQMIDEELSLEIHWYCYEELSGCLGSVYRVRVPCEEFTLEFNAPANYEVIPNAFGFIDRSQNATNAEQPNVAKIQFDGWIFPDDGAIINLRKKS